MAAITCARQAIYILTLASILCTCSCAIFQCLKYDGSANCKRGRYTAFQCDHTLQGRVLVPETWDIDLDEYLVIYRTGDKLGNFYTSCIRFGFMEEIKELRERLINLANHSGGLDEYMTMAYTIDAQHRAMMSRLDKSLFLKHSLKRHLVMRAVSHACFPRLVHTSLKPVLCGDSVLEYAKQVRRLYLSFNTVKCGSIAGENNNIGVDHCQGFSLLPEDVIYEIILNNPSAMFPLMLTKKSLSDIVRLSVYKRLPGNMVPFNAHLFSRMPVEYRILRTKTTLEPLSMIQHFNVLKASDEKVIAALYNRIQEDHKLVRWMAKEVDTGGLTINHSDAVKAFMLALKEHFFETKPKVDSTTKRPYNNKKAKQRVTKMDWIQFGRSLESKLKQMTACDGVDY